jgi:hypothetical protein
MVSHMDSLYRTWFLIDFGLTILLPFRTRPSSTQPETRKLQQVCCRLDSTCDHQADIRMRSNRLLRLDNIKFVASCPQTCCMLSSTDLLQVVNCRLDASCELQNWFKLWTADLLQVVNCCRLDSSCDLQTWCKLWTADLMQVVNCRFDASCELQTWCKLWTAGLMQFVNCRLDAICELQTWCKLSSTDLMQVVKRLSEESALWGFVYPLFWTKNGQTGCHISVVVFRKITRLLHNKLAR